MEAKTQTKTLAGAESQLLCDMQSIQRPTQPIMQRRHNWFLTVMPCSTSRSRLTGNASRNKSNIASQRTRRQRMPNAKTTPVIQEMRQWQRLIPATSSKGNGSSVPVQSPKCDNGAVQLCHATNGGAVSRTWNICKLRPCWARN